MSYKYLKDNNIKNNTLILKKCFWNEIKIVFISKTRHAKWDYSLQTFLYFVMRFRFYCCAKNMAYSKGKGKFNCVYQ